MDFRLVNRLAFNQIIHRAFQLAMVLLQIHSNSEAPQTNLHRFHLRDQRRMRILQPLQFNLEMHLQRQHLGSSRISKDFSLELDPLMYLHLLQTRFNLEDHHQQEVPFQHLMQFLYSKFHLEGPSCSLNLKEEEDQRAEDRL